MKYHAMLEDILMKLTVKCYKSSIYLLWPIMPYREKCLGQHSIKYWFITIINDALSSKGVLWHSMAVQWYSREINNHCCHFSHSEINCSKCLQLEVSTKCRINTYKLQYREISNLHCDLWTPYSDTSYGFWHRSWLHNWQHQPVTQTKHD